MSLLTKSEIEFFQENGYLIKRNFVSGKIIKSINSEILFNLKNRIKPFELEHEVDYPGSPKSIDSTGGNTIRRLLLAYDRGKSFKSWSMNKSVASVLQGLFQSKYLKLVQSHHNCIMTKQPEYSSETHWHKDIRYWNFNNDYLINTWLPMGNETIENGCLQVIPKSHLWNTPKALLDQRLFLRKDLEETQQWIQKSINVELAEGDLLFFHAALFHSAGKNTTQNSKNALVYTYHSEINSPIKGSKSARFDEVQIY